MDALSVRSDVISPIKILPLLPAVRREALQETASQRRGNRSKGFKDFDLQVEARMCTRCTMFVRSIKILPLDAVYKAVRAFTEAEAPSLRLVAGKTPKPSDPWPLHGYLAYKKQSPSWDHHRALGIVLL